MKLSVSVSADDVELIDAFARSAGLPSRSAVIQHAVQLLRFPHLEDDYASAWAEWQDGGEHSAWESAAGDGLDDAPR